jgi:CheY-like chemotaxis protein
MIDPIIAFFERQSWLANLMYFAGAAVAIAIGAKKRIESWWTLRNQSLEKSFRNVAPTFPATIEDMLRGIKVAVVDDEPNAVPVEYLRKLGIQLFEKPSVSFTDIEELRTYDLVFLDIVGVVDEDPKRGGLKLLERLKSSPNGPLIIAISSKRFDPLATDFFRNADDVLNKPISPELAETTIKDLLRANRFPPTFLTMFQTALDSAHLSKKEHRAAIRLAQRSIVAGRVTTPFVREVAGWKDQSAAQRATSALTWLAKAASSHSTKS